jgi:hypothetical protein
MARFFWIECGNPILSRNGPSFMRTRRRYDKFRETYQTGE